MIRVYILSNQLSKDNIEHFQAIADRYGREMVVIELGDVRSRFPYEIDTGVFDVSTMSRFFMAEMIPESEDRILYLDCDTIVVDSLAGMWEESLDGYAVAAVMEPTVGSMIKTPIGLEKDDAYYNAGVLLINLAEWRVKNVQKELIEFYRQRGGKLFANDQDTINGALKDRIKTLEPKYNFFTNLRYFPYSSLVSRTGAYATITRKQLGTAKKAPALLHYLGDERPWKAGNLNHYRKHYEKYLAMTPYAGTPKEAGGRCYLLVYHLMEWMTVIFPELRFAISDSLGVWVIHKRAEKKKQLNKAK